MASYSALSLGQAPRTAVRRGVEALAPWRRQSGDFELSASSASLALGCVVHTSRVACGDSQRQLLRSGHRACLVPLSGLLANE